MRSMLGAIPHRGPDGTGIFNSMQVTLGHRRLSIIDLSDDAAQPMSRGSLTVVFNGEIYNYLELRAELAAMGQAFVTDSDTEVLLAAYEAWGPDCVTRFNGMWAFVLFDFDNATVVCSRDRFGEKPLLYSLDSRGLVVGSEARQFHAVGIGTDPDLETVRDFVVFGASLDMERTYYSGIQSLPPATNMTVSLADRNITFHGFYIPGLSNEHSGLDQQALLGELDLHLRRSVRIRLRSDVPVGMLLSGGVDSSAIATIAGPSYLEETGRPLMALTAASGDSSNDEAEYARMVAHSCHAEWIPVRVSPEVTREAWAEATRTIEQPLGSSSLVMQLMVMAHAKKAGITVLLDGQGADESWMGYGRYAVAALHDHSWHNKLSFARGSARNSGLGTARWLAQCVYFSLPSVAAARARHRLAPIGLTPDRDWFKSRFAGLISANGATVRETQLKELHGPQLTRLLRFADLTSMASSVEDRLPYLDHQLVDLALSLPTSLLFKGGWSKWPLRNHLSKSVSADVAWRKRKIGFEAPRDAFSPRDPDAQALIRNSRLLREMGLRLDDPGGLARAVAWRLFAVSLWEREIL